MKLYISILSAVFLNIGVIFSQWLPTYVGSNGSGTQIQYLNMICVVASQADAIFVNPEIPEYHFRIINSYNNGSTWSSRFTHYSPAGQSYYVSNFSFYDGNNGAFTFKTSSTSAARLYRTGNSGDSWSSVSIALTEGLYPVSTAYIGPQDIAAIFRYGSGYNNHYLYLSTNGGTSWISQLLPNPRTPRKIYFYNENSGYIVSDSGTVLKTTNKGLNWTVNNTGYPYVLRDISFCDSQNGVTVGGTSNQGLVFKTTNGGGTWNLSLNSNISGLITSVTYPDAEYIYASGRIILGTSNGGASWLEQAAFPSPYSGVITSWNRDTVIAFARDKVYRTDIGVITAVSQPGNEIPVVAGLEQNYPNPFNPATRIKFNVHQRSAVRIIIYDFLGKQAELLIDKEFNPGTYEIQWNAAGFSSGVYFCKMTTEGISETNKMILLK